MAKKNINYVKSVVIIAIGAALYGFGGLLSIPVFTNTYLKPAMAVLGLFAALWGGLYPYITKKNLEQGVFGGKQVAIFTVMSLISNFVGYGISVVFDVISYGEPFLKSLTQQQITTVCNTVVMGIIGSALMLLVAKKFSSNISLSEDPSV